MSDAAKVAGLPGVSRAPAESIPSVTASAISIAVFSIQQE